MNATAGPEALPFGEFLAVLRARGFAITVEHHLRLARLIERTGSALAPADLKKLLCPIFATDAGEQEAFYAAFDSYFCALLAQPLAAFSGDDARAETQGVVTSSGRRWPMFAIPALAALMVVLAIIFQTYLVRLQPAKSTPPRTPPRHGNPSPPPQPTPDRDKRTGDAATPDQRPVISTPPPPSGQIQKIEDPRAPSRIPLPPPDATPRQRATDFLKLHRIESRSAVLAVVLMGFSLGEWRRWRRRNLLIERARKRRPPFSWPVHVGAPKIREFHSQSLFDAARAMRRRQAADTEHLDLLATLQATIRGGGMPRLVYRRGSRVPEYLILIDCASPRDHQAAYFDHLAGALEREGVFISRYFFRGDPRICWNERATSSLADLRRLHADFRLLIFGDGAGLLDPLTGDPAPWLPLLFEWREQTLLTPAPSGRWGLREETLETLLPVMPATLDALAEVPDLLERGSVEARTRTWRDDAPVPPKAGRAVSIEALREYLGHSAFEWLCACAIYPELQWNLTLFLGAQLPDAGHLLCETMLLRLTRLQYFRDGVLPDELRAQLIAVFPIERQRAFRRALIALLESNPPPRGSHAADAREIDIAIHQNWIERQHRRPLVGTPSVADLPFGDQTRDYSELRLHERSASSRLAFLLPGRLRAAVQDRAVAPLGIRPVLRFVAAVLLACIGWLLIDRATQPAADSLAKTTSGAIDFNQDPFEGRPGEPAKIPPKPTPVPQRPPPEEPSNNFEERVAQGKTLRERGDINSAITKFREAITMDPKNPIAISELAVTYEKMGLPDKAAEQWKRVWEMGDSAGLYFSLADAKLKAAQALAGKVVATQIPQVPPDGGAIGSIAAGATLGLLPITTEVIDDDASAKTFKLHLPIKARPKSRVDVRDLVIHVLFYDIVDGQNVVQTSANVSSRWMTPPTDWADTDTEELVVDYQMPKPDAQAAKRENRKYFGYIVRIYYKKKLQAAAAEPERLAQQYPPPPTLPKAPETQASPSEQKPTDAPKGNPPVATPPPSPPPVTGGTSLYQGTADFARYAMKLRESAMLRMEPGVMIPTTSRSLGVSGRYPWKTGIVTIPFWIGKPAKGRTARNGSAWDPKWKDNFGGVDKPDPESRKNFAPAKFTPRLNPFYIALPYNDVAGGATKPEARQVIPWFKETFVQDGKSVCRDRWVAIRNTNGKICYAQWSDCGPFVKDHWQYVFGNEKPRPNANQGAGLEISPAVRDFLGLGDSDVTDWKFVDFKDVPLGPWSTFGENNDFVQAARHRSEPAARGVPLPRTIPSPSDGPMIKLN